MIFTEFLGELIGTFFFITIILVSGDPLIIAIGLLASIHFASFLSKSSLNPAVSFALLLNGKLSVSKFATYLIGEFLGGLLAVLFYKYGKHESLSHFYNIKLG